MAYISTGYALFAEKTSILRKGIIIFFESITYDMSIYTMDLSDLTVMIIFGKLHWSL